MMDKQLIYREDAPEIVRRTSGDYAAYFETDANWTGYDLTEQEMNETIHCPVCGKNPFPDQEVQVCDIVRVVKFVDIDVEGEACE